MLWWATVVILTGRWSEWFYMPNLSNYIQYCSACCKYTLSHTYVCALVCVKAVLSWNEISGFWISIVEWWHDLLTSTAVALQQFGVQWITNSLQQAAYQHAYDNSISTINHTAINPCEIQIEMRLPKLQPKFCQPTSVAIYTTDCTQHCRLHSISCYCSLCTQITAT